jgi:hypothetical protein
MAALDGDSLELYLRRGAAGSWLHFAEQGAALLGARPPVVRPYPRPAQDGFCLSLRWQGRALTAVTMFAEGQALPDDRTIAAAWREGMEGPDERAYDAALGGVRALGPAPPGGWHGMLGWTIETGGACHRAASLRVPVFQGGESQNRGRHD